MVKDVEIAAAIREKFPKHSKAAYSMAKRTPETGLMLCPAARDIRDRLLGKKKYPENRKNGFRIYGRLPDTLGLRMLEKLAAKNMSVQDLLIELVTDWLIDEDAPAPPSMRSGTR